jgi:hypothetical protein
MNESVESMLQTSRKREDDLVRAAKLQEYAQAAGNCPPVTLI